MKGIINKMLFEFFDKYEGKLKLENREYFIYYLIFMINQNSLIEQELEKMLNLKETLLIPIGIQLFLKEKYPNESNAFIESIFVKNYKLKNGIN